MDHLSRRRRKASAVLNLASAAANFTSVVWSLHRNGPKCLALYSDQTALFGGIISLLYARKLLEEGGRPETDVPEDQPGLTPHTWRRMRYATVCSQVLVTGLSLVAAHPALGIPLNLKAPHLILMHFVGPGLSALSYFGLERDKTLRFPDTLRGYAYTAVYAAIAIPLAAIGIADTKAYPFLNYAPGHRMKAALMDAAILSVAYLGDLVVLYLSKGTDPELPGRN